MLNAISNMTHLLIGMAVLVLAGVGVYFFVLSKGRQRGF